MCKIQIGEHRKVHIIIGREHLKKCEFGEIPSYRELSHAIILHCDILNCCTNGMSTENQITDWWTSQPTEYTQMTYSC